MTDPQGKKTVINVKTSVSTVEGNGEVTGFKVQSITAEKVVVNNRAPIHRTGPINQKTLISYLEACSKDPEPDSATPTQIFDQVKVMLGKPFRGHPVGQPSSSQDLYDLVHSEFECDASLKRIERAVIIGDAGSGLSLAMNYLRKKCAEMTLGTGEDRIKADNRKEIPRESLIIPILVKLGNLNTCELSSSYTQDTLYPLFQLSLNERLEQVQGEERKFLSIHSDQIQELVEGYHCFFLLDELEILFSNRNSKATDILFRFIDTHRDHRYVITCRASNYRGQLGTENLMELEDLSPQEVMEVLGDIYNELDPNLQQLVRNRRMLRLFLGLNDSHQRLQNRGQLFQDYYRKILSNKDDGENLQNVDAQLIETLLESLAFTMKLDRTHYYPDQRIMELIQNHLAEWHEPFSWRHILYGLQDPVGLLQHDEGKRLWSFVDRQAESFYAASAVTQDGTKRKLVVGEARDARWRDTLQIMAGIDASPAELLYELIDQDVLVAAECVRDAGEYHDPSVMDALIDALLERMTLENSARRKRIVGRIADSGEARAPEALMRALHQEWSSMVCMAIVLALKEVPPRLLSNIEKKYIDTSVIFYEPLSPVFHLVETKLHSYLDNRTESVKRRGLGALRLGLSGLGNAYQVLIGKMEEARVEDFLAWCCVEALIHINPPDLEKKALEICQEPRFAGESWTRHRARAVYLLGCVGRGPEIGDFLKKAYKDHNNPIIRGYAVDAMSRLGLPFLREFLEERTFRETNPGVLRKSAEALGQWGNLETIPAIDKILTCETARTNLRVRSAFRRAKGEIHERFGM